MVLVLLDVDHSDDDNNNGMLVEYTVLPDDGFQYQMWR